MANVFLQDLLRGNGVEDLDAQNAIIDAVLETHGEPADVPAAIVDATLEAAQDAES
jgi:hypothetical protein